MYTYNKETINELVKDLNEVERYRVINFIKDLKHNLEFSKELIEKPRESIH